MFFKTLSLILKRKQLVILVMKFEIQSFDFTCTWTLITGSLRNFCLWMNTHLAQTNKMKGFWDCNQFLLCSIFTRARSDQTWSTAAISRMYLHSPFFLVLIRLSSFYAAPLGDELFFIPTYPTDEISITTLALLL